MIILIKKLKKLRKLLNKLLQINLIMIVENLEQETFLLKCKMKEDKVAAEVPIIKWLDQNLWCKI